MNSNEEARRSPGEDLTKTTLIVLFISGLLLGSFWVIRPFFFAFLWASLIVIPTWPLMQRLCTLLGGRRGLTVTIITLLLFLLVVIPMWVAVGAVIENRQVIIDWIQALETKSLPPAPQWVVEIPVVGSTITKRWQELAEIDHQELVGRVTPYLKIFLSWLILQIGGAGIFFVHCFLTLILTVLLFLRGEVFAQGFKRFARRLGGERGVQVTVLAAQALKAVAMGVVVTAFIQAAISAVALAVVGVPYPMMLAAIIFFLAVIQIGAFPVILPAIVWLFWQGLVTQGIIMVILAIPILGTDNILRPILIQRGANLPLLLIFAGVIGGLVSFGIIGLFIGPIVLAVAYTLLNAWVNEIEHQAVEVEHV